VNRTTTFSITAKDFRGSGILKIWYKINNSEWMIYDTPFNLYDFQPSNYIIYYYSIDNTGNIEEIHNITIILREYEQTSNVGVIGGYNLISLGLALSIFSVIMISSVKKKK